MAKILVIDDDRAIRRTLELVFSEAGHHVIVAGTAGEGTSLWENEKPDLILLDLMLPDGNGLEMLDRANERNTGGMVIMITGHQDLDKAISAMKKGAYDYIHKPISIDELEIAVERALETEKLKQKVALVADIENSGGDSGKIVGKSSSMVQIHKLIGLASRGKANILITGESGTGKELVARAIHRHGASREPLIPVNCSAFAPTLLESELFGYEKGAFTGAYQSKPGRLELAGNGILFLDEIGDLDLPLQVKLLRVLQERTFERVGGRDTLHFTARVIAATHKDLTRMVHEGTFREDLYYRLKVIEIHIAPLRERKEDIEPLTKYLLEKVNRDLRQKVTRVPQDVLDRMIAYDWPGNVRELENRITAGVMLASGTVLQIDLPLPEQKQTESSLSSEGGDSDEKSWKRSLEDVEKEHIKRVLERSRFNFGKVCNILGISRPTLRRKMQQYGLSDE